jgi:hypothetical protein
LRLLARAWLTYLCMTESLASLPPSAMASQMQTLGLRKELRTIIVEELRTIICHERAHDVACKSRGPCDVTKLVIRQVTKFDICPILKVSLVGHRSPGCGIRRSVNSMQSLKGRLCSLVQSESTGSRGAVLPFPNHKRYATVAH